MKAVLLSSLALPFPNIGSWNKRYTHLLQQNSNPFNYVICPKIIAASKELSHTTYFFASLLPFEKFTKRIVGYKYYFFLKKLHKLLLNEKKLIVFIVDNVKLLTETQNYLTKKKLRSHVKIIFNSCGYSYYMDITRSLTFYNSIDHFICATQSALEFEKNRVGNLSQKTSVLSNGVDETIFQPTNLQQKAQLKKQMGYANKKIVLWVSQDRPKKGLNIFLESWQNSKISQNNNTFLLVIGTDPKPQKGNIKYLGKIPNPQLPDFYKMADYYFFTTQIKEGFGLTLAEAIKCGTYCFASHIDPLPEITLQGAFAQLVKNPNQPKSWQHYLDLIATNNIIPLPQSSLDITKYFNLSDWEKSMTALINTEKNNFKD